MKSHAANLRYLKSLVDRIAPIPREFAIEVSFEIFMQMVDVSLVDPGFDSGQAAANWRMEGYYGSPSYESMRVMWGYGDTVPEFPVGYKSYYQNDLGRWVWAKEGQEGGNPDLIDLKMGESATIQSIQMPKDITGITVYNPISSGFPGLLPGDVSKYEQNALDDNKSKLGQVISQAVSKAEIRMRERFKGVVT